MNRLVPLILFFVFIASNVLANTKTAGEDLLGLAVSEARFSALQGEWFEAITRLDRELQLRRKSDDVKKPSLKEYTLAENSLLDFELSYRLYQRDGAEILSDIERNSDEKSRNSHLLQLAKLYFHKGQTDKALSTLDLTRGENIPELEDEIDFFKAQLLMAKGLYNEAIEVLDALKKAQSFLGFAGYSQKVQSLLGMGGYNLGISFLSNNNESEGLRYLDLAGQITSYDEATLSIRDKANLVHGEYLLNKGSFEQAGLVLDRVRLEGPFSSLALLSAGWVAASQDKYEQALVPWTLLSERNTAFSAVQQAMLAVPYSYSKLGIYNKAARLYERSAEVFGKEIESLNSSIASIREGHFLKTLLREEKKQDMTWFVRLRELPEMPETYYLLDLMAQHEYQDSMQNYLDLGDLRARLVQWQQDLLAFEELIEARRAYYEPLLPETDIRIRRLERRISRTMKRRNEVDRQLTVLRDTSRPELLASKEEVRSLRKIDQVDKMLQPYHVVKTEARIERLRGLIYWSIYANYDQRLNELQARFDALDGDVASMREKHESLTLNRRAAEESYKGHNAIIDTLRSRIKAVLSETTSAMVEQGDQLNAMMIEELTERREKLKEMQVKARFAMAENYDRATMKQKSGVRNR